MANNDYARIAQEAVARSNADSGLAERIAVIENAFAPKSAPSKLSKVLSAVKKVAENPVVQLVAVQLFRKLTKRRDA